MMHSLRTDEQSKIGKTTLRVQKMFVVEKLRPLLYYAHAFGSSVSIDTLYAMILDAVGPNIGIKVAKFIDEKMAEKTHQNAVRELNRFILMLEKEAPAL